MRHDEAWARERFDQARVARLATASSVGSPLVVPITFAIVGNKLISAVDHKPKSTATLRRLDNIAVNPFVSVLVDFYDEDWDQLWWARVDGWAYVHQTWDLAPLVARYPQYERHVPAGPVIVMEIDNWSSWSAA